MRAISDSGIFSGKLPQLLAVFTGTIGAVSDGMHYGWTSPSIPILEGPDTPVQLGPSDEVWLENIYMLGGLAGLPVTIYCVDKFGRKNSILIAAVQHLISWILIALASSVEFLYVARFLSGLAGDVAFVSAPMYIAEIADKKIRGMLSACIYIMMLIGILVVYSVGPFVSIQVTSMVGGTFILIQIATFSFMPESPYYYLVKGKMEKAKKALQFIRGQQDVEKELTEISAAVERQNSERGRPIDLLIVKSNRKALLIMTVLNASQHFSSISVILMNIHTILEDANGIIESSTAAIIFAVVMLIASSSAATIVDKCGRKVLLASSSFFTGLSLAVLASYFAVKNAGIDVTTYNWVPVVIVMTYAAAFKYGLGMVPIVMTGEVFPTSVKAMGMTISDAMYVIFGVASIYLYQSLASAYGMHVPFFIFAGSCMLTMLFTIFVIPETKGKTLEEIQFILKGEPYVPHNENEKTETKPDLEVVTKL